MIEAGPCFTSMPGKVTSKRYAHILYMISYLKSVYMISYLKSVGPYLLYYF